MNVPLQAIPGLQGLKAIFDLERFAAQSDAAPTAKSLAISLVATVLGLPCRDRALLLAADHPSPRMIGHSENIRLAGAESILLPAVDLKRVVGGGSPVAVPFGRVGSIDSGSTVHQDVSSREIEN